MAIEQAEEMSEFHKTSINTPITPKRALQVGNAKKAVVIGPIVTKLNKLLSENISDDTLSYTWYPEKSEFEAVEKVAAAFRANGWHVKVDHGSQYNETWYSVVFEVT